MKENRGQKTAMSLLVRSCRLLERMANGRPQAQPSEAAYFRMLGDYFERIVAAGREGTPTALHTVFMPAEILYAMDIVPIHGETSTWMTATFSRQTSELLEKASELELATEICSAHRGLAGAYALDIMPRPDVILWSNLVCDNTAKSGEMLVELTGSPGFFLDHPFRGSAAETDYLVDELREMIEFLESATGRKMNWEALREIIERFNRQMELAREISELRKAVPSPFPPNRFLELITPHYLLPGQQSAIRYLETLRDDLAEAARAPAAGPSGERFRLMSLFVPPMYLLGQLGKYADEYGAVSVVEPLFSLWGDGKLDPTRPLQALAQKSSMFPEMVAYGPFKEETLKKTVACAREYRVDGAIFYAHIGCRQAGGLVRTYKDALNKADIPMLVLDFDLLDPTVTPEADIRRKLESFLEMLDDRKN